MRQPGPITREFLLSFWKIHILHHASEAPIYGQGILEEIRSHGYSLSPGTLYPLLARMAVRGWLRPLPSPGSRREYALTPLGRRVLMQMRSHVAELHREIVKEVRHD